MIHFMKSGSYKSSAITPISGSGQIIQVCYQIWYFYPLSFVLLNWFSLSTSVLVTGVQWAILLPIALRADAPEEELVSSFFNFWSYNMNGFVRLSFFLISEILSALM